MATIRLNNIFTATYNIFVWQFSSTPSYNHGVIKDIVTEIPESNFDVEQGGQVEIIGWIYQYYNTEPKEKAISSPKSHKFKDTEIASVTQIFTPDWIVKYMVQNSLGKIWIKSLLEKNDTRLEEQIASDFNWQYYMKDAQQPENVIVSLKDVDKSLSNLEITDLKMIDPSMGSGHILVYAFDLLMQIYQSEGYSEREASKSIVTNNLFGLDIDTRAFQLSYFAVYMKLRQYNRRALTSNIKLNIYDIPETNEFNSDDFELLFNELNEHDVTLFNNVINLFHNGNDLGSLIMGLDIDYDDLYQKLSNLNQEQMSFELIPLINSLKQLLSVSKILSAQYHIIITNPPYMGSSRMNKILGNFAKTNYPDAKSDLFSMFIERWNKSMIPGGYNCMVTMQSWMFLSSFEKMRTHLLSNFTISNLMHMENNVMGIAFGTAVTIVRNMNLPNFIGTYHQIKTADTSGKIPSKLPIPGNRYNRTNQANFSKIPGSPIAYWASENLIKDFEKGTRMDELVDPRQGLATADNNRFLRMWYEVINSNISFNSHSIKESLESNKKWFPYNKGGSYRKWYGNYDYVVNWENDGYEVRNFKWSNGKIRSVTRNPDYYFHEAITWSDITSGNFSIRYRFPGSINDVTGMSAFSNNKIKLFDLLGLMNSSVGNYILKF
ncbi:BREX-1 system adenine-specific DNA-methyltransferase PglX [Companilactobacillus alimentarius]|uniref:site-specific DNA-methyltransferase (adenine-specific) n=3 Tax=Companilactobacillus alimentarius TaxID=1602 RepID=A0A2N9YJR2_9LACO|nr:BREX-1 system adenine-specific DNA-methyltransferase PglX [Companilactobacillus alimentarius]AUI70714.1 restriction endonuclease [Companilactobacillus alimentarius DSM 20249]